MQKSRKLFLTLRSKRTPYLYNCRNATGINLTGGVIVKDGMNWVWSRYTIEDTINRLISTSNKKIHKMYYENCKLER